jgi:hypothetical protein
MKPESYDEANDRMGMALGKRSQMDNIPAIRRPKPNPVYNDPFRDLQDNFKITTPDPDPLSTRPSDDDAVEAPIDEEQNNDHPFAIKVKVSVRGTNGDWTQADVGVLSGTYETAGGSAFNANGVAFPDEAVRQFVNRNGNQSFTGYVYLYVPLEQDQDDGVQLANSATKAKAVDGGEVRFRVSPAIEWPNAVRVGSGVATAVRIGTWSIAYVQPAGPPGTPRELRVNIEQTVKNNIVLGEDDEDQSDSIVPAGETKNDILYWDDSTPTNKKWVTLAAPSDEGTWVLGVKDGTMQWIEAEDCDE